MTGLHQESFGQGKTIVMIHGWAMHSGIWRDFARDLGQRYRVICIDLPGHGQSEKLLPFTLASTAELVANSVTEPECWWLGWSLGALVTLDIAARFPQRCRGLILLAGNPHFVQTDRWPGIRLSALKAFSESLAADSPATLLRFLSLQINETLDYKELAKRLRAAIAQCPTPDHDTLEQGLQILKASDLRAALAALKQPVSVILGNRDTLVPAEVGYRMQQLLPELELNVLDKAGHVPFLSHREQILALISHFMERT
jgi:pimeloyl-[acyl-carrier protein] methyl ester esterase